MTLKLAANKLGRWSEVTEAPVIFVKTDAKNTGTKVYLGQAVCPGAAGEPYDVKVRVTTVNGRIVLLEDNGTLPSADTDYSFWWGWNVMGKDGMPAKLKGKTLAEVIEAKTVPGEADEQKTDAVSGATLSSDAVKYAVIDALRSEPVKEGEGELAPPVLESTRRVSPNGKNDSISVVMSADEGLEIHYTLDGSEPTKESPKAESLPPFREDRGVRIKADASGFPEGRVIVVKAAAFQDGKRSAVAEERFVFAKVKQDNSYRGGTFQGTFEDITAKVDIESPNFDQKYYIVKVRLDDASEKKYASFLPELMSRIYLKQGTEGVLPMEGQEDASAKVLKAVQAALDEAYLAAEPVITVSPDQRDYANSQKVELRLSCATKEAEIYYVVDNSRLLTGGRLSDFEKNKKLYEGPVEIEIGDPAGGTLYIRAAAKTGGNNWSPTARKDLSFVKGTGKSAVLVEGSGYGTWKEAVAALEKAGGGEMILQEDVELLSSDRLPAVSCTIRSEEGKKYRIKGGVFSAGADIAFDNVIYDINRIYAAGHSVSIGSQIETPFSFSSRAIFAGPAYDAEETEISADPVLTVESGKFALYGSGGGGTKLKGDVLIKIEGTAQAEAAGAYMNAQTEGKVTVLVEGTAALKEFLGEQSKGSVGELRLEIHGAPELRGRSYRGSVNGTPKGTLDLTDALLSEEETAKFRDFAEINTGRESLSEETSLPEAERTPPAEEASVSEPAEEA